LSRPSETAAPIVSDVSAPSQPSSEAVLESLVRQEPVAAKTPKAPHSASTPVSAPSAPVVPESAQPVDLSKANDALSGLLGGKSGKGDKK
jgi:hypothetical protein